MKVKNRPVELIILSVYFALFAASCFFDSCGKWLLLAAVFMCLHHMRRHRYNQVFQALFVFILTYFLYMSLYYFLGIPYCSYKDMQTLEYTNGTLRVFSLFVVLLFYFIEPKEKGGRKLCDNLPHRHNSLVFWGCAAVMLLITAYALSGKNMFTAAYGKGTTNSTLFEYYFIFAVVAHCNIGTKTRQRDALVLIAINLLYACSLLLLGLRLVTLMVLLMVFALNFEDRFPTWLVVFAAIMGFFGMSAMSMLRMGFRNVTLLQLLGVSSKGVLVTNQGDVFQASTVHYGMVHNGFMDWPDRIKSLGAFFANIFLPSSMQFRIGILNKYIEGSYKVGGGGFGAMYAYVWLGIPGTVLLALFLAHFINKAQKGGRGAVYGVFLIITSIRWLSYSLPIVFKMGFYLAVFYMLAHMVKKTVAQRREPQRL